MKRIFLRVGVLALFVVLGLIAYAYGQRGDRYAADYATADDASQLGQADGAASSKTSSGNPLRNNAPMQDRMAARENVLRAGPPNKIAADRNAIIDPRVRKVAAESPAADSPAHPAADPFGPSYRKMQAETSAGARSTETARERAGSAGAPAPVFADDSIPDASALNASATAGAGDAGQSRYPQFPGPSLGPPANSARAPDYRDGEADQSRRPATQDPSSPPMVGRYPAGAASPDRYGPAPAYKNAENYADAARPTDRYGRAAGTAPANTQEPAPFQADPSSAPTALSSSADRARDRNTSPIAGNARDGSSGTDGIGQPAKQFEGAQSPQVIVQKFAPKEIQVGKAAVFKVVIRNTGQIPASQVEIHDQVPRGTKLLGTSPKAALSGRGTVVWKIGTLRPGEESSVEMELMPIDEGEIGSVATVHFGADASARTTATRPQLLVELTAPEKVMIGEQVTLSINVSNPGTGVASGVVLEEHIPPGLQHPAGTDLEYEVGDLRPGESKKLDLPLAAVAPGKAQNVLTARADGNLHSEARLEFQVVAPKLDIALDGPKRRYLEREAVYQVSLTNPGTAPARQVELAAYLPPGLKFISANNSGHYNEANHVVSWRLEELPCNETGTVELVTMPVQAGQHSIKLRGTAEKGLAVEKEQPVLVEGLASIVFQPVDVTGPIEVGGETTYEVHVVNQGSKAASNVRLAVLLPSEMQPLAAEGPTRYAFEGNRVVFEGIDRLPPKADANYRLRVKGVRPGDLRTRFQLVTDEMQTPVTKEESTRVFADE
jgi:uncharacterized repeat protein (TIGR01451 family)